MPGNNPTPVFDPTKTNSVLISSAGQMGRGGNVTIDGQDNNDDVVGGPLLNLPIDAVQEFQIATNRFGADLGRSASSVINVVTRSGTNTTHGTAAIFARDDAWQALPPTLDNPDEAPPFDRQQISGAFGGPLRRDRLFWFASGEYPRSGRRRPRGTRDTGHSHDRTQLRARAASRRTVVARLDSGGAANRFMARYAGEWATDTAASAVERAIGSATQRQDGDEPVQQRARVLDVRSAQQLRQLAQRQRQHVSQRDAAGDDGAAADVPEPRRTAPRSECRRRRARRGCRSPTARRSFAAPTASRFGGEVQRVDAEFRLGVFQQGRIEFVEDFPTFDHTGDGRHRRQRPAVCGHAAQRQARSGTDSARRRQHARRRLHPGRLERVEPPAAEPRAALRGRLPRSTTRAASTS